MELEIEARVENLDEVLNFIEEQFESENIDCPTKIMIQLDVAVEEIFVNIAHYAYGSDEGMATIRVDFEKSPLKVKIAFIDSGFRYNPLEKKDPDITLSAEERPIGGLGIYMVKKSMDATYYEYKDEKNIFTIEKLIDN